MPNLISPQVVTKYMIINTYSGKDWGMSGAVLVFDTATEAQQHIDNFFISKHWAIRATTMIEPNNQHLQIL